METLMSLKGNAQLHILSNLLAEAEKLRLVINDEVPQKRARYLEHLAKIDLFLNALKIQFSSFLSQNTLTYQLMSIDTYISQIIPIIESMRQI